MRAIVHDCAGALLVRDGRLLLGRRAPDRAWLPGAWDVFGGHLQPQETPEEALRRELREELGIVPIRLRRLETLTGEADEPWRLHLFVTDAWHGEPGIRQPQEHAELRWCALEEAQQRLAAAHPAFPDLLAQALDVA